MKEPANKRLREKSGNPRYTSLNDLLKNYQLTHFFRHFDASDKSDKEAAKLFSVPDFVGDSCKAIASRIRGAVAGVQFDDFHKVWYNIIYTVRTI